MIKAMCMKREVLHLWLN